MPMVWAAAPMNAWIAQDVVCLVMCAIATITDVRHYRIPNWLTLAGACCGIALNALLVPHGLLHALGSALLAGMIFGLFGAMRFVGMGDVKLMAAVGALLSWPLTMYALAYVGLAGGVVAVAFTIGRGQVRSVTRSLRALTIGRLHANSSEPALHRIPYAVAIFLGASVAVAARYIPALRL